MQSIRIRQATTLPPTKNDLLLQVHNTLKIAELLKLVSEKVDVSESELKLYYGGKELTSVHSISDYKIKDNDVVQFLRQKPNNEIDEDIHANKKIPNLVSATSEYYKVGDPVDVMFSDIGAWFESRVIGVFTKDKENQPEDELIFQVVMDRHEQTAPLNVRFKEIRPRAHYCYKMSELEPGMITFVNYNIKKPKEIGYWYDFKIINIHKKKYSCSIQGILLLYQSQDVGHCCTLTYSFDGIMRIEQPTLLPKRLVSDETVPLRKLPLYCKKCKDVPTQDCKECACTFCGRKNSPDKMIICDDCDCTYHIFCLVPPLLEIPGELEWYCPDCKTDVNEIVKPGNNLKVASILDIKVGTSWDSRSQMAEAGIHASLNNNIHFEANGVCDIILEDKNEVYGDDGNEFYYTPHGVYGVSVSGNIITKLPLHKFTKTSRKLALNCNNVATASNCAFGRARNWKDGRPIRVIRSKNLGDVSKFVPHSGYRYDGMYKIVEYFPELVSSKFIVLRFLMRRDDPSPPPWSTLTNTLNLEVTMQSESRNKKPKLHVDGEMIKISIELDTRNKTLWDECNAVWEQGNEVFVRKVEDLFTCVCCQGVVHLPVTTNCNHNICGSCLRKCFASKFYQCPMCRVRLDGNVLDNINIHLSNALKLIFSEYNLNRE